jgi:hypothetical protein
MSRGPGLIERRIADLFAATRDRALSVEEIAAHAFQLDGARLSRAQRLSATRAAHRLLRRIRELQDQAEKLVRQAHENTKAALGREQLHRQDSIDVEYLARLDADPAWIESRKLVDETRRVGVWTRIMPAGRPGWLRTETDFWCATKLKGRLFFNPPDAPIRVWVVSIQPAGVIWAEAEVVRITERNVMVRYAGAIARLNREKLWHWWAWWRGVMFVSTRSGRIAGRLHDIWQRRFGKPGSGVPPAMPLAEAIVLLGVTPNYTREDIIAAFRRGAKRAHPDLGGTVETFRRLVEARDRLLAALGTSAPEPKMPEYAPTRMRVVYRSGLSRQNRLGSTTRYLT